MADLFGEFLEGSLRKENGELLSHKPYETCYKVPRRITVECSKIQSNVAA